MKIFIYGDSNTWGYFPTVDHYSGNDSKTKRHEMDVIWWNSLKDYELIVDGNIGRSSKNDHPYYENKNAIKTISKDLENVSEVDLAIIMLGTNDCKKVYGNTPSIITNNLSEIIDIIKAKLNSKILVICPPLIMPSEKTEVVYNDGTSMIRELEKEYQKYHKKF